MLSKLPTDLQRTWEARKRRLGEAITDGADFKPWPPGGKDVYSVRMNKGFRAHLQYQREQRSWVALEIADHKTMGHG